MSVATDDNGDSLMKKTILSAALLAALAGQALAADIPARTYSKAPAYTAPAVVYNWTGFYIGGHVGGAFAGDNSLQSSDARFLGGVQAGFDYQFAPNWVLGAEAQYSWLNNGNGNNIIFPAGTVVTGNVANQIGSVTGRVGYTWGPGLLYAKGGYAWRDGNNIGVTVGGVPQVLHHHRQHQGRLHRRRRPRIHVRAQLVGQGRVPVLQFRQHHDHGRARARRRRPLPGRRAQRQGRRELSLRLGRPGGLPVLRRSTARTEKRPAHAGLFCLGADLFLLRESVRRLRQKKLRGA